MKKISFLLTICSVMLTACSPQTLIVATPTPTASAPTAPAPIVAPAVTEAPTIAPTATEAIDPDTGWKMQIVDGEKQLFSPDVNAWVVPDGSSYLIRHDEWSPISDAFQMQVFHLAQNDFVAPIVSQAPVSNSARINFTTQFMTKVELREFGHMLTNPQDDVSMLQSGKPISLANGESFTITKDSKYRVYIMPYDQMPDGYLQVADTNLQKHFRWLVKGDGTNAISIVGYEGKLSDLSKQKFIKMVLYGLAVVMDPNQNKGLYTNPPSVYPAGFGDYINTNYSVPSFQVNGLANP